MAIPDSMVNVPVTMNIAGEFSDRCCEFGSIVRRALRRVGRRQFAIGGRRDDVLSTTPTAMGSWFVHRVTISVTPGQERQVLHRHGIHEHGPGRRGRDSLSQYR